MKRIIVLTLALLLVISAVPLWAVGIEESGHNVPVSQNLADTDKLQGSCSFCHTPHTAQGEQLFPSVIDTSSIPEATWRTVMAGICWDCHSGTTYPRAVNTLPFGAVTHGNAVLDLFSSNDIAATDDLVDPVVYKATSTTIDCVSCHDPHNNTYRPFIRANPGFDNNDNIAVGQLGTLCDDCHYLRDDNDGEGTSINHPTATTLAASASSASIMGTVASLPYQLRSDFRDPSDPMATAGQSEGWNLGGHMNVDSAGVNQNTFDCATCHAVHLNETTDWTSDDGNTLSVAYSSDRVIGASLIALSAAPTANSIAPICDACHNISDAATGPGVSGSTHPFNSASSAWALSINTINLATGTKGVSDVDRLTCQSCHKMHFAPGNVKAIDVMVLNQCNACHDASSDKSGHHPTAVVTADDIDWDGGTGTVQINDGYDWTSVSGIADTISADGSVLGTYLVDDVGAGAGNYAVSCGTCHSGSRAHNVQGGSFPQGLVGELDESEMCVDCHGPNPSDNTANRAASSDDFLASHYLGAYNSTTRAAGADDTGLAWGYAQSYGDTPKYGADTGTYGDIICESCHSMSTNSGTSLAINTGDNEAATSGTIVGILAPSGNSDTNTASGYLCSSCHGKGPGAVAGGTQHAFIDTTNTDATVQAGADAADNGVTLRTDNEINCESCHRPHDAATASGTLILEQASAVNSTIFDEAPLCGGCHTDKY